MSDLIVNTKKLEEIYQEWRGNKSCYDNGKPVFEADELLDFAEYCLKHEANGIKTSKEKALHKHIVSNNERSEVAVCHRCGESAEIHRCKTCDIDIRVDLH